MELARGNVAVVTGGASGIGFAMAERFATSGLNIVLADVQDDALGAAADAPGYPVTIGRADLRQACVDWLERRFGVAGLGLDHVLPTVGSKELIAALPLLLTIFIAAWLLSLVNQYFGPSSGFGRFLGSLGFGVGTSELASYLIGLGLIGQAAPPSPIKHRLRNRRTESPEAGRPRQQRRHARTLETAGQIECQSRKERRLRHADFRVRRSDAPFRGGDIGTPLQKLAWQGDRNPRRLDGEIA